jgi:hypothetical protein
MNKPNLPWTVKQLKSMYEDKKTLDFNHPIQRQGGQWNLFSQSLLIHSMLANYPVPPVYFIKEATGEVNEKGVIFGYANIDGKQRLTTIFDLIADKYKLHKDTPSFERDGEEIVLANKLFSELDSSTQEDILRFKFNCICLEDATDDEIEEVFFRLNNGVVLSANQKAKAKIGVELAQFLDKLLDMKFFKETCSFSQAQLRKADDMCALLQSMMLLDGDYQYKSISSNEALDYAINAKDNFTEEQQEELETIVEYLGDALIDKSSFARKINIPMLFLMARKAIAMKIDYPDFWDWFNAFSKAYTPECEYAQFCSTGSIKKEKTNGRIDVITKDFDTFFKDYPSEEMAIHE